VLTDCFISKVFLAEYYPLSLFEFWRTDGLWTEAIKSSWPIFVWGSGITFFLIVSTRNSPKVNRNAEYILIGGTLISLRAGVVEEICFRWLIFYGQIIIQKSINWITFGLLAWLFMNVIGPVANFFTLGYLKSILFSEHGWIVGSAIIGSNGMFRNGHKHLGKFGFVNSWFLGMFFFFIMFKYGLPAAILIHFLYDLFLFLIIYIDAAVERKLGWV
jgi:hypothetical protein